MLQQRRCNALMPSYLPHRSFPTSDLPRTFLGTVHPAHVYFVSIDVKSNRVSLHIVVSAVRTENAFASQIRVCLQDIESVDGTY